MRIVVLCRFQKNANDPVFEEIEQELNLQRTLQNDFDIEKERAKLMSVYDIYDYLPLQICLKDVCTSNSIDAKHTSLRLYNGNNYTIKINFYDFITIYENLTGYTITDFSAAVFSKPSTTKQQVITNATE